MSVTVAVVDGDARILDAISLVLEAQGWIARTYSSCQAFLTDLARDWSAHCLVWDPHLPGISGDDIALVLRGIGNTPVIGLTARPTSQLTNMIAEAGARVVLTKPISAETLIDQIERVITGARPESTALEVMEPVTK